MSYCDCAEHQQRLSELKSNKFKERVAKLTPLQQKEFFRLKKEDQERYLITQERVAKLTPEQLQEYAQLNKEEQERYLYELFGDPDKEQDERPPLLNPEQRQRLLELSAKRPEDLSAADAEELENLRKLEAAERALAAADEGPSESRRRPFSWWYDFWVPLLTTAAVLLTLYAILKRLGYWDAMKRRMAHSEAGRALLQSPAGRYLAATLLGRLLGLDELLAELDYVPDPCPIRIHISKLKWPVEPTVTPLDPHCIIPC